MAGSLRELSPGVWQLRVRTGRDPVTGKYNQASRTFRGKKREAEAELAAMISGARGGSGTGGTQTVAQLLDRWVDHLEAIGRSPKTIDGYRSLINARLNPALGHIRLRSLKPDNLDSLYRGLLKQGLSPLTVRHCHAALATALRQAVKWGWIDRNPAERATPPPVPHAEIKPPSPEEITKLFTELQSSEHELASMVYAAATTGCRRGELCGLKWSDVDFENSTLTVSRSITDTTAGVAEKDPKTHRSRRLAVDATTIEVLAAHRSRMTERAVTCGAELAGDAYVWSQDAACRTPYRPDRVTGTFRKLRKDLGLDRVTFHHLRHFSATTLAAAGIDVRTIAGRLGHANPAVTLKTYAHFLDVSDRKAADVMGGMKLAHPSRAESIAERTVKGEAS